MKRRGLLLILVVICARPMLAWGAIGHRVVAAIAEKRLEQTSPAALAAARELLRSNNYSRDCAPCDDAKKLPAVANQPDEFRQDDPACIGYFFDNELEASKQKSSWAIAQRVR